MINERFIVTGARRNNRPFSMKDLSECYQAGIYEIDFAGKSITRQYLEKEPNREIYTKSYSLSFRSGSLKDDTLYTCTHSEIINFDLMTFKVIDRFSHPLFNDVHHVNKIGDRLYFADTGIDHMGVIEPDGKLKIQPVSDSNTIENPNFEIDYRRVSTKPHKIHPNHVSFINDKIWVTRFNEKDAICLNDPSRKIDISCGKPHDGLLKDERIHFTTVNGMIVVFDCQSLKCLACYNIPALYNGPNPGWCRGLEIVGHHAYIGFSSFRWTLSLENLGFLAKNVASLGKKLNPDLPARIIKYDMKREEIVGEMRFDNKEIDLIFSILKY